jgi:RNA polymerase sigma factor (sigma-70 family)
MSDSIRNKITKAQKGDSTAIAEIVHEFSELIHQECQKFGIDQHPDWSHSDQSQEVLIRVLAKIGQFSEVDSENPRAALEQWLRITTRNWLNNLERYRKAKKRFPEEGLETFSKHGDSSIGTTESVETASAIVTRKEEIERVQKAMLEHLTGEQRQIMELRVVEGLTLAQIAERLPLSIDQIRYRFEQSMELIKRHI